MKAVRAGTYWCVVALAVAAFGWGASEHARAVNHRTDKDQGAYLALATRMLKYRDLEVDGARPPLYPALLTLAWRDGIDRQEFFARARSFTVVPATLAWLAFLFVLRRQLRSLTALAVWLAIGLPLWMFYAPYVKAEALFFPFATTSFMLLVEQLQRPRYGMAAVTGAVSALGQLLKASLGPALWLFALVQALVVVRVLLTSRGSFRDRRVRRRAAATALCFAPYFLVLSPYLVANTRVFGHPFYNVNSDFYVWYDSWGDAGRGTKGHGDRKGFPTLPPNELPSAQRYFQKHDAADAVKRLERGAAGLAERTAAGPGFLPLTLLALGFGLGSFVFRRRWMPTTRAYWPLALFAGGYFAGYLVLYSWFYAINPGIRFVAALFGPALFLAGCLADRSRARGTRWAWAFPALLMGSLVVLAPTITSFLRTWSSAGW